MYKQSYGVKVRQASVISFNGSWRGILKKKKTRTRTRKEAESKEEVAREKSEQSRGHPLLRLTAV